MKSDTHSVCLYGSAHDLRKAINTFLKEGLSKNYKLLYFGPERDVIPSKETTDGLPYNLDDLLGSKTLEIIDFEKSYVKNGVFDPVRQISFLQEAAVRAIKEGYNGLGVAGEGTAILESGTKMEELLKYEASVSDLVEESPVTAYCLYDSSRIDQSSALEISRLHPYTLRESGFSVNEDYYRAPRRTLEYDTASRLDICRGTANSLLQMFRMKSIYVEEHEENVSKLASAIAKEMALDSFTMACLEMAGKIHDLGMNSMFLDMLTRPGPLHALEARLLRRHPITGFEISRGVPFPDKVSYAVFQHHERIDGSGYPNGLKDSEISLEGSILAVSEVVAAMSFYRPYRKPYGVEYSLDQIDKNKGSLYRTEVVEACLTAFENGFSFESSLKTSASQP